MTDPIADLLTRIRNALQARHKSTIAPLSKIKVEIAKILQEEGYIEGYAIEEAGAFKNIKIKLKYTDDGAPVIEKIDRKSRPGRRYYINKGQIPRVKGGFGISIISTSEGVITGVKARKLGVGGELLATVS